MSEEGKEFYDGTITENDVKIPMWLKISYVVITFWGLMWLIFYFEGMSGFLDRGYWYQLEKAANTTQTNF